MSKKRAIAIFIAGPALTLLAALFTVTTTESAIVRIASAVIAVLSIGLILVGALLIRRGSISR